jgi:hypothetical protein
MTIPLLFSPPNFFHSSIGYLIEERGRGDNQDPPIERRHIKKYGALYPHTGKNGTAH